MSAKIKKKRFGPFHIIIASFAGVILLGAALLLLPFASSGAAATLREALFTATSAVCVTGLVVRDTGSAWAPFGQAVILLLIQIGGLGVVTVAATFALMTGRRISLMQRSTMLEAMSAPSMSEIRRLTGFVVRGTLLVEAIGAVLLLPVLLPVYGARGIWLAVFHAISAFCNAGFDIFGTAAQPYVSLTGFADSVWFNAVIMLLIVSGGLGFLTWDDIRSHGFRIRRYRMQSKVILVTSAALIVVPAAVLYFAELSGQPHGVLAALFQSVTTRTAGFNTADLTSLSGVGRMLMIALMLVGGSPGSTAGGMKTTTLAVLVLNASASLRRRKEVHAFGRRIDDQIVRSAAALAALYLVLALTGAAIVSLCDGLSFGKSLFETASAIGTVGLTLGVTPQLGAVSHAVLMLLMFFGRVGGLTLFYAAASVSDPRFARYPQEKITIG
ncbi:MAG: Trk family potassium uptake protein [Oscillospiraceae bacterium]|nr:Trk family potassium uptake protein [Oscillospiraceae bacterium]